MKRIVFLAMVTLAGTLSGPYAVARASDVLALTNATIVDVSHFGRSSNDITNSVIVIHGDQIVAAGSANAVHIPQGAAIMNLKGAFVLPGLVDGFSGLSSQAEANAALAWGVTTIVGSRDPRRVILDLSARPSPHVYRIDTVGERDNYNALRTQPVWANTLTERNDVPMTLSPADSVRELRALAHTGTRVVLIHYPIDTKLATLLIPQAQQLGLVAYAELGETSYSDALKLSVNALLHDTRYDFGLAPDTMRPQYARDPFGTGKDKFIRFLLNLRTNSIDVTRYAEQIRDSDVALLPTASLYSGSYRRSAQLRCPKTAAQLAKASGLRSGPIIDRLAGVAQRLDRVYYRTGAHFLTASGAGAFGTLPGVSLHTELELLTRIGLTPREALAAATANYAALFNWKELGLIAAGRRADLIVVRNDPRSDICNADDVALTIVSGRIVYAGRR